MSDENIRLLINNDKKEMENLSVRDTILPLDLKVKYSPEILFCADSHNLKFSGLKALFQPSHYDSRHILLSDFCKELSLVLLRALQGQIHELATKSKGVIAKKKKKNFSSEEQSNIIN